MTSFVYRIPEIPDLTTYRMRSLFAGDLRIALAQRHASTLRLLARWPDDAVRLGIRAEFHPEAPVQDRLRWFVQTRRVGEAVTDSALASLGEAGPLGPFYPFEPIESGAWRGLPVDGGSEPRTFSGYCEVVRHEDVQRPSVDPRRNTRVPSFYYAASSFVPNELNDWVVLDRALGEGAVRGPVVVDFLAAPMDVATLRREMTRWLSHLRSINSPFDEPYDPEGPAATAYVFGAKPAAVPPREKQAPRDPLAEEFAREAQEALSALRGSHLRFAIRVLGATPAEARTVAAVVAESAFRDDRYRLVSVDEGDPAFVDAVRAVDAGEFFEPPPSPELYAGAHAHSSRLALPEGQRILRKLARLATPAELAGAFKLPSAPSMAPRCMRRTTDPRPLSDARAARSILVGHDLETGAEAPELPSEIAALEPVFRGSGAAVPELRLPLELLQKHAFIVGASGSGKTVATLNLLVQLHRAGIPWLVIEPAKTEYRVLAALSDHPDPEVRRLAEEVRIFTPGDEFLSPMRIHPFAFPSGGRRDEHIDQLYSCFRAAFPLPDWLGIVVQEAIERVYESSDDPAAWTMEALREAAREVLEAKGYGGETAQNARAAIDSRIGALTRRSVGRIFSGVAGLPDFESLLRHPTVIELEHVAPDVASFLTLVLLSGIREHLRHASLDRGGRAPGGALAHVIVIEEAHNLVGRTEGGTGGEDSANPKLHAARYVSRMLAEIRSLGEGILIVDQLPSAVAPEVVKNTGIKYAARLVAKDDREDIAAAMLLSDDQKEELARLRPGEAFLYHEELHAPRRTRALDADSYLAIRPRGLAEGVFQRGLLHHLQGREWYRRALERRFEEVFAVFEHAVARIESNGDALRGSAGESSEEIGERLVALFDRELDPRMQLVHERLLPPLLESPAAEGWLGALEKHMERYEIARDALLDLAAERLKGAASAPAATPDVGEASVGAAGRGTGPEADGGEP